MLKVEQPGVGDPGRRGRTGTLNSPHFINWNCNKRLITINLQPDGPHAAERERSVVGTLAVVIDPHWLPAPATGRQRGDGTFLLLELSRPFQSRGAKGTCSSS